MKTAEQWAINLQQYGDTFKPTLWIELQGSDFVDVVKGIQADAIEHCLQTLTASSPYTEKAFNILHRERLALEKK